MNDKLKSHLSAEKTKPALSKSDFEKPGHTDFVSATDLPLFCDPTNPENFVNFAANLSQCTYVEIF